MRVRLYHSSGIPAGTFTVVAETKTKITVMVNGGAKSFSKNTKRQLGTPKLSLVYREA